MLGVAMPWAQASELVAAGIGRPARAVLTTSSVVSALAELLQEVVPRAAVEATGQAAKSLIEQYEAAERNG